MKHLTPSNFLDEKPGWPIPLSDEILRAWPELSVARE